LKAEICLAVKLSERRLRLVRMPFEFLRVLKWFSPITRRIALPFLVMRIRLEKLLVVRVLAMEGLKPENNSLLLQLLQGHNSSMVRAKKPVWF
jgi:hypothetical protein